MRIADVNGVARQIHKCVTGGAGIDHIIGETKGYAAGKVLELVALEDDAAGITDIDTGLRSLRIVVHVVMPAPTRIVSVLHAAGDSIRS